MGIGDSYPGQWLPIGKNGERIIVDTTIEEVFEGNKYTALTYGTISASAYSILTLTAATDKETIIDFGVDANKPGVWRLSENAVVSGATTITAYNNNRRSTNTYGSVVKQGGEIVTVGTVLGYHVIGSATGGAAKSGGSSANRNPWVLATGKTYMITYQAESSDTQVVQGFYITEGEL